MGETLALVMVDGDGLFLLVCRPRHSPDLGISKNISLYDDNLMSRSGARLVRGGKAREKRLFTFKKSTNVKGTER